MTFGVLFVCRANICRSPMAESLLRAALPAGLPVTITSAGTHALVGHTMDVSAAHAVRQRGGDPDGHHARQLTDDMVTGSDLILAATAAERDELARRFPVESSRLFTLREFARLAAAGDGSDDASGAVDELRQRARAADTRRDAGCAPCASGQDDIGDPFGAPEWLMAACADAIADAVRRVAAALTA